MTEEVMSTELVVSGFKVATIEVDGVLYFNMNELHAMSPHANNPNKRPSKWLRTNQAKGLIKVEESELFQRDGDQSPNLGFGPKAVIVRHGGYRPGTYCTKKMLLAQAAWLDPYLYSAVLEAFIAIAEGRYVKPDQIAAPESNEAIAVLIQCQTDTNKNLMIISDQIRTIDTKHTQLEEENKALQGEIHRLKQIVDNDTTRTGKIEAYVDRLKQRENLYTVKRMLREIGDNEVDRNIASKIGLRATALHRSIYGEEPDHIEHPVYTKINLYEWDIVAQAYYDVTGQVAVRKSQTSLREEV